ncbi:MAG: hypothetical protein R6V08_00670 [Desulfuromonadales bacterium]
MANKRHTELFSVGVTVDAGRGSVHNLQPGKIEIPVGDPSSLGRYLGVLLIVSGVATLNLSH